MRAQRPELIPVSGRGEREFTVHEAFGLDIRNNLEDHQKVA